MPTGSVLMFDYGGEGRPRSVEARAYPLKQEKQWLPGPDGTRLMSPKEGRLVLVRKDLRVHRDDDRGGRNAGLPPPRDLAGRVFRAGDRVLLNERT